MGKTNYNKISEEVKEEKAAVVEPEVTAEVVEEPAEVKETKTAKTKKPKVVKGIVANCASLRVRKEPAVKSDNTISVIDANTEVEINQDESTKDWYKIITKGGLTGFCMKDYITVK